MAIDGNREQSTAVDPTAIDSRRRLSTTLKAWPVIALATIGLCFLTQQVAKLFGIELPDQANIDLVRQWAGWNRTFAFLCLQILVLLPALEELVFRYLLFQLPLRLTGKNKDGCFLTSGEDAASPLQDITAQRGSAVLGACQKLTPWAILSSALFSAAHYIAQPFPDAAFIALFFFGLAQCWLYKKTDRLWCPILNHALFNLTNLILLFIIPQS